MENKYGKNKRINYVINNNYFEVNNRQDLNILRENLKNTLKSINYPIINKSTNSEVYLNSKCINKLLFPAPYFNPFCQKYITILNALFKIEQLFMTAVYVATLKAMKNKKDNELFHHFASPLIMNNLKYRILITVSENINSGHFYITSIQLDKIEQLRVLDYVYPKIKIHNFVKDIKIYNYDKQDYANYDIKIMEDNHIIKEDNISYCGILT